MVTVITQVIPVNQIANLNSMGYDNWWCPCGVTPSDVVAVYKPKGAASYANSLVNIADPGTRDAIDPGDLHRIIWDSTFGWTCVGTDRYLIGSFTPEYTWTYIARFNNVAYDSVLSNCSNSSFDTWGIQNIETLGVSYYNGNGLWSVTSDIQSGVAGMAGNKAYLNGNRLPETIPVGTGNPLVTVSPFGTNNRGAYYGWSGSRLQVEVYYNKILTDEQVASVSSAMAAL